MTITCFQVMQQTTLGDHMEGGASGATASGGGGAHPGSSLSRRKAEEKNLFETLPVSNPYSLFGKSKD